jgi:hypothetical protein
MELVQYDIKLTKLSDKQRVCIIPLGDIQYAGPQGPTTKDLLKSTIQYGQDHDAYYIGMGDYIDFMSPSNRHKYLSAGLYDTTTDTIDEMAMGLMEGVYEKFLKPTKNRWFGMLEGHHFHALKTGYTTDQRLCELLNARFLGTTAYIGIHFWLNDKKLGTVNIWATHGCGGGSSPNAPASKLGNTVYPDWEADVYLIGHMTKKPVTPVNRVYPTWGAVPKLRHRARYLVGTGGFAKGYVEGSKQGNVPRGSYVEAGMMRPAVLGAPVVWITPRILDAKIDGVRHEYFDPKITVEV